MGFIDSIDSFDKSLTLAINSWSTPFTDALWAFMSQRVVWIPLYLLLIYLVFRKLGWKKGLVALCLILLCFAAGDQLCNLVKNLVQRPRPCWNEWMVSNGLNILEKKGGPYGFYSGHAVNVFCVVTCFVECLRTKMDTAFMKVLPYILYIWAAMVGISRVFVGKHYLGDVLVGAAVGLILGLLFGYLCSWVNRKFEIK